MHKTVVHLALVTGFGVLCLAGCQSTPTQVATIDAQPSDGTQSPPRESLPLFGDDPTAEQVPFENRLITNLRQHSFTMEGLDFDPDVDGAGETLVFASTRNAEQPDLFLKNVEGSAVTQLTGDPSADIQPRFSPDNEHVVFCSNRSGNWDIWLIGRDGTGLTQLTSDPGDEIAPCWAPDGNEIAYTVWGYRSHQWEVWTLAVDSPGVRRFLAYGMFPAWSPDGKQIAFQRARQRGSQWHSVWTIDLVDGEARHPTEVARSELAACIAPSWSQDGSMLVYCAVQPEAEAPAAQRRAPRAAELWTVDLSSGLRMKLTGDSVSAFNPVWGPEDRIFFVSARNGTENVWSLTADLVAYARGTDGSELSRARDIENAPGEGK
ncbi:MAG: hypothetical protein PVJ57_05575 [Phycisphaerae bacterium]|jgi:Tol biopolymer transport system component